MNKKSKTGTNLVNKRVVQVDHNCTNRSRMHHHLLVHIRLETVWSIMARICKTSSLDPPITKVVWYKGEFGLLYVVSLIETTLVNVVIARQVVDGVVKMVTSWKSVLRMGKVV